MDVTIHIYPIYYVFIGMLIVAGISLYTLFHSTIEVDGLAIPCTFSLFMCAGLFIGAVLAKILIPGALYIVYCVIGLLIIKCIYGFFKDKGVQSTLHLFAIVPCIIGTVLTRFMW